MGLAVLMWTCLSCGIVYQKKGAKDKKISGSQRIWRAWVRLIFCP
jgi:rubredoxin